MIRLSGGIQVVGWNIQHEHLNHEVWVHIHIFLSMN